MLVNDTEFLISLKNGHINTTIYDRLNLLIPLSIPFLGLFFHIKLIKINKWVDNYYILFRASSYLIILFILFQTISVKLKITLEISLIIFLGSHMFFCGSEPFITYTKRKICSTKFKMHKLRASLGDIFYFIMTVTYFYAFLGFNSPLFYLYSFFVFLFFVINNYVSLKLISLTSYAQHMPSHVPLNKP